MKARHYFSVLFVLLAIALAFASQYKGAGLALSIATAIELITSALFDKKSNT